MLSQDLACVARGACQTVEDRQGAKHDMQRILSCCIFTGPNQIECDTLLPAALQQGVLAV